MLKFYTAIGRYELRVDDLGMTYPVVFSGGQEYILSVNELVIWSGLLWNIQNRDELRVYYEREANAAGIADDVSFEDHLRRLEQRELVVCGTDMVGIDAVYNLLSKLYVVPVSDSFPIKLIAFFRMLWKGIPFQVAGKVFKRVKLSLLEKQVMRLARKELMPTAELIRRSMLSNPDLAEERPMIEATGAFHEMEREGVEVYSRFSGMMEPVVQAVSNLYLGKLVMLEKYV